MEHVGLDLAGWLIVGLLWCFLVATVWMMKH